MSRTLKMHNRKVVIIIATGYYEHEYWFPYYRFQEEGAEVITAGPEKGTVYGEGNNGKDGLPAQITHAIDELSYKDFDVVYLPGGIYGPLELRAHKPTIEFVKNAFHDNNLAASICHAPWILISAGIVNGRKISCPYDMKDDVINAGGIYLREKCIRDGNLITADCFRSLPEQFREIMSYWD
jgi:protease I